MSLAGYGKLVIYSPDYDLYWKPKPNQDAYTKIGRHPVRVNSHGTRGAEFEAVKPEGTFRIICLGDSRTFGWGLAEEDTYSKRLENLLRAEVSSDRRVEVINAGVNAWSYPQMLTYMKKHGLAYQPDLVIMDGANLWTEFTEDQPENFRRSFLRKVRLKNLVRRSAVYHYVVEVRLKRYYEEYRTKAIATDARPDEAEIEQKEREILASLEGTMESMSRLLDAHGSQLILLHTPREDEDTSRANNYIKTIEQRVADRTGCIFLDLTASFQAHGGPLFQKADPVHPNAEGNAIVAAELLEAVNRLSKFDSFRSAPR